MRGVGLLSAWSVHPALLCFFFCAIVEDSQIVACTHAEEGIKKSVFLQSIKKKKTMKKNIKTKEEAKSFFQKIIDDKNAMIDCIENGGDMKALIKNRGIEIVKPLSVQ